MPWTHSFKSLYRYEINPKSISLPHLSTDPTRNWSVTRDHRHCSIKISERWRLNPNISYRVFPPSPFFKVAVSARAQLLTSNGDHQWTNKWAAQRRGVMTNGSWCWLLKQWRQIEETIVDGSTSVKVREKRQISKVEEETTAVALSEQPLQVNSLMDGKPPVMSCLRWQPPSYENRTGNDDHDDLSKD